MRQRNDLKVYEAELETGERKEVKAATEKQARGKLSDQVKKITIKKILRF